MAIESRYPLKVLEEVEPFPPIQNTASPYLSEAAMHIDQANQLQGYGYLVDGVGAFTYLGTVVGTAADYEAFGGGGVAVANSETPYADLAAMFADQGAQEVGRLYVVTDKGHFEYLGTTLGNLTDYRSVRDGKDIILRSDNTSSSLKFLDNLTVDNLGFFMRYNAASNFFEIGSADSETTEVIIAKIDRGKADWEFQDRIQILKPGRGVNFLTPSATELDGNAFANKYELRVNEGGVIELWTIDSTGGLDALVWSSETSSGLDLRASNLAEDLSIGEQSNIKGKLQILSGYELLTSSNLNETIPYENGDFPADQDINSYFTQSFSALDGNPLTYTIRGCSLFSEKVIKITNKSSDTLTITSINTNNELWDKKIESNSLTIPSGNSIELYSDSYNWVVRNRY